MAPPVEVFTTRGTPCSFAALSTFTEPRRSRARRSRGRPPTCARRSGRPRRKITSGLRGRPRATASASRRPPPRAARRSASAPSRFSRLPVETLSSTVHLVAPPEQRVHQIRPDEAGAARHERLHAAGDPQGRSGQSLSQLLEWELPPTASAAALAAVVIAAAAAAAAPSRWRWRRGRCGGRAAGSVGVAGAPGGAGGRLPGARGRAGAPLCVVFAAGLCSDREPRRARAFPSRSSGFAERPTLFAEIEFASRPMPTAARRPAMVSAATVAKRLKLISIEASPASARTRQAPGQALGKARTAARATSARAPPSGRFVSVTSPPQRAASDSTTARPSPVPLVPPRLADPR